MMYPILCKVQYEKLHIVFRTREIWIQLGFSLVLNWIIAPLFMLGLAWAFLPDEAGLRNGLVLVGIARCIAMVLIWTNLVCCLPPSTWLQIHLLTRQGRRRQ